MARMRTFLLVLLSLPVAAFAQPPAHGLLWRIDRSDGGAPSFLLGTLHSRDARAYTAIDLTLAAMDATGAVFGELDMQAAKQAKSTMALHALMDGGRSLKDLYPPAKYKRVEKALRAKIGPLFMMVSHMKPILLSAMLTEESMGKDSSEVLDDFLQNRARERGMRTGGIETVAEQFAAMDAIPLQEQADILYQTARTNGGAKEMERILNAYAAQDLDAIAELMKDGDMSDAFSQALLTERNRVMVHRIDSIADGTVALFAVGAAHLPGSDGVLSLLRAKGFVLSPVTDRGMIGPPLSVPPIGEGTIDEEMPPPPPTDSELQELERLPRQPAPPIIPK